MHTTPQNVSDLLEYSRDSVKNIQNLLETIFVTAPSMKDDPEMERHILECRAAFQQAEERLKKPTLRIATIGTTSAGKSTLVNAMVGRKIAPMDAAELSAGVLHLVHDQQRRLVIEEEPKHKKWDGIDVLDWSDEQTYNHVREKVFKPYNDAKKEQTIPVPKIKIQGPLLPGDGGQLLNLPNNVAVEIFDLPGANSTNDKDNLEVIRDYLKQSLSLIVMDYSQTDKSNRQQLLKEVKSAVDLLGGRTDALVFALNRVDMRNKNDDPLEGRIEDFANAIKETLSLEVAPKIIPISCLAQFYAQSAWGWCYYEPVTSLDEQRKHLQNFRHDCSKFIRVYGKKNKEIINWLRDIEDAVNDSDESDELSEQLAIPEELLTQEHLIKWLDWVQEHSGVGAVWSELNQRVQMHFPAVVLAPILAHPIQRLKESLAYLNSHEEIQRIANDESLNQRLKELDENFNNLGEFLKKQTEEYTKRLDDFSKLLHEGIGDEEKLSTSINLLLGDQSTKYARDILSYQSNIVNDLQENIILPVVDYFNSPNSSIEELKKKLNVLTPEARKAICKNAERYRNHGMSGDAITEGIKGKERVIDKEKVERLKNIEMAMVGLFTSMRKALAERANFLLKSRDHLITALQESLRNQGLVEFDDFARKKLLKNDASYLLAILKSELMAVEPKPFPDDLFTFKVAKGEQKKEKKIRIIEERSCLSDRTEDYDVDYYQIQLPSLMQMKNQWGSGIDKAKPEFWNAFCEWFKNTNHNQKRIFLERAKNTNQALKVMLETRSNESKEVYDRRIKEFDALSASKNHLNELNNGLELCYQKAGKNQ